MKKESDKEEYKVDGEKAILASTVLIALFLCACRFVAYIING